METPGHKKSVSIAPSRTRPRLIGGMVGLKTTSLMLGFDELMGLRPRLHTSGTSDASFTRSNDRSLGVSFCEGVCSIFQSPLPRPPSPSPPCLQLISFTFPLSVCLSWTRRCGWSARRPAVLISWAAISASAGRSQPKCELLSHQRPLRGGCWNRFQTR